MRERTKLDQSITAVKTVEQDLSDTLELLELGEAEADEELTGEVEAALTKLAETVRRHELESLLSGEADGNDAYLEIHAGAGGTESCDWANMLLRSIVDFISANRTTDSQSAVPLVLSAWFG